MVQKKMSTHGAVNIPVQMRRSMGLQPKDVIELEDKDGALILRPREIRCVTKRHTAFPLSVVQVIMPS